MRTFITKSLKPFIMLCLLATAATSAKAQNETVNFSSTQMSAGKLMAEIEGQTRYKFGFEQSAFDTMQLLKIERLTMTIDSALQQLTAPADASYMIRGSVIILSPKAPVKTVATVRQPTRTSDRYRPTDQRALANAWADRPATQPEAEPAQEQIPVPAVREYPAPYSAYTNPNLYTNIQHKLPLLAVKINLLYGAAALAPNLSGEIGLGPKTTLEVGGSWNRFNRIGTEDDNKKFNHWTVRPEFRYWLCERYNGHFFGLHGFYGEYNISQHKIPMLFDKQYRYEGNVYGGGITYGYHLILAKRWGVEFHVGLGVAQFKYDKYDCTLCSDVIENSTKTYFGPTRAGISLVFLIK